jgi:hypothetical protein
VTLSTGEALLLGVNAGIPSTSATSAAGTPSPPAAPSNTCDGTWSAPGKVYARRAAETVLSTSAARPLWASVSGLENSCRRIRLQTGPRLPGAAAPSVRRALVAGDTWYSTNSEGVLTFIIADANPGRPVANPTGDLTAEANWDVLPRLNPVAAGSIVSATTTSRGLTVSLAGGSPVANTTEATLASVSYSFTDPTVQSGTINLSVKSPSGLEVTYTIGVDRSRVPATPPCSVDP